MMKGDILFNGISEEPFVKRSPEASISSSTKADAAKSGLKLGSDMLCLENLGQRLSHKRSSRSSIQVMFGSHITCSKTLFEQEPGDIYQNM